MRKEGALDLSGDHSNAGKLLEQKRAVLPEALVEGLGQNRGIESSFITFSVEETLFGALGNSATVGADRVDVLVQGQIVDKWVPSQTVVDQDENFFLSTLYAFLLLAIVGQDVESEASVLVSIDFVQELLLVPPQLDP